jgi:SWI/SNF-related matrix-associated actin-dependent regulator 1 of chromatin subfamily A
VLVAFYTHFQPPVKMSLAAALAAESGGSGSGASLRARDLHELYRRLAEQKNTQSEALNAARDRLHVFTARLTAESEQLKALVALNLNGGGSGGSKSEGALALLDTSERLLWAECAARRARDRRATAAAAENDARLADFAAVLQRVAAAGSTGLTADTSASASLPALNAAFDAIDELHARADAAADDDLVERERRRAAGGSAPLIGAEVYAELCAGDAAHKRHEDARIAALAALAREAVAVAARARAVHAEWAASAAAEAVSIKQQQAAASSSSSSLSSDAKPAVSVRAQQLAARADRALVAILGDAATLLRAHQRDHSLHAPTLADAAAARAACERHEARAKAMLVEARARVEADLAARRAREPSAVDALLDGLHPQLARALRELLEQRVRDQRDGGSAAGDALQGVVNALAAADGIAAGGGSSSSSSSSSASSSSSSSASSASPGDATDALLASLVASEAALIHGGAFDALVHSSLFSASSADPLSSAALAAREAQLRADQDALSAALAAARYRARDLSEAVLFDAQVPAATRAERELLEAERAKLHAIGEQHRAALLAFEQQLLAAERDVLARERQRLAEADAERREARAQLLRDADDALGHLAAGVSAEARQALMREFELRVQALDRVAHAEAAAVDRRLAEAHDAVQAQHAQERDALKERQRAEWAAQRAECDALLDEIRQRHAPRLGSENGTAAAVVPDVGAEVARAHAAELDAIAAEQARLRAALEARHEAERRRAEEEAAQRLRAAEAALRAEWDEARAAMDARAALALQQAQVQAQGGSAGGGSAGGSAGGSSSSAGLSPTGPLDEDEAARLIAGMPFLV